MKYLLGAALALAAAGPAHAQSLEDQLRGELLRTRAALKEAQDSAAPLKARAEAAEKERDQLKAKCSAKPAAAAGPSAADRRRIAALEADLAAERGKAAAGTQAARGQTAAAQAELATARAEARQARTERDTLRAQLAEAVTAVRGQGAQLDAARAKNARLYAIAREVIDRFERLRFTDLVASREPFLGRIKVQLQNEAEGYRTQAYSQKMDAKSALPPMPAAQPNP